MKKIKIILFNLLFVFEQLSLSHFVYAGEGKLSYDERFRELESEINKRIESIGAVAASSDIEKMIQKEDEHGVVKSLLENLFTCSASLIESGYGLDSGSYETVVQGALYLQLSLEVRRKWNLKKMLNKADGELNSSFVPRDAIIYLYTTSESCENYLSAIKKNNLKPSRFPNPTVLNEMVSELRTNYQIDERIINLVIYATDYFRRDYSGQDVPTEERRKDPFSGKAICIEPKIYSLGVPFVKLYKLSMRCVSPLGRVVDYESGYQIKIVGSFVYQIGESAITDRQHLPMTMDQLSANFKNNFYIEEKVSLGFAEVGLKSLTGDVYLDRIAVETETGRKAGSTLEKLKERSRQSGGLYLGFGTHKLTGKLKERRSVYAPMERSYSAFIRSSGNIPKALGFHEYWWSSPDSNLDEELVLEEQIHEINRVDRRNGNVPGTGAPATGGDGAGTIKPLTIMHKFPFENEIINPHYWQDQVNKYRKHAEGQKGATKYRIAKVAAKGDEEKLAALIASDPALFIPALEGRYIDLLTPKVSAYTLVYMSRDLTPTTNIPYSHYIATFVQKYIRHLAHRSPQKITFFLESLLNEMGMVMKDVPPSPKEAGVLIGGIVAGTIQHVYAIRASDERRTLIINSLTNLIWAGTTFVGVLPFLLGNVATLIAGGVSFAVVTGSTIWNFAETPRDYSSMIKEIEGRIKMNALQVAESHIEEKEAVTTMLQWMDATILVNGQPD